MNKNNWYLPALFFIIQCGTVDVYNKPIDPYNNPTVEPTEDLHIIDVPLFLNNINTPCYVNVIIPSFPLTIYSDDTIGEYMPSNVLSLNEVLGYEVFVYGGVAKAEDSQYYIHKEKLQYTSHLGLTRYHILKDSLIGITIKINYDRFQYIPNYNISYTLWHEMLHMVGFTHCDGNNIMNAILTKKLVIDDKQLEMFRYVYKL